MEIKHSFLWINIVIILKKRVFALGIFPLSVSPMVQKKLFIDSAMPALVEMCFPSTFMNEMLVGLDFLFKTLLMVFHVFLRSPSQEAIL